MYHFPAFVNNKTLLEVSTCCFIDSIMYSFGVPVSHIPVFTRDKAAPVYLAVHV